MSNKACKGRSQDVGILHRKIPKKRNHGSTGEEEEGIVAGGHQTKRRERTLFLWLVLPWLFPSG